MGRYTSWGEGSSGELAPAPITLPEVKTAFYQSGSITNSSNVVAEGPVELYGSSTSTVTTLETFVDITGSGVIGLLVVTPKLSAGTCSPGGVKITIDDVVVYNNTTVSLSQSQALCLVGVIGNSIGSSAINSGMYVAFGHAPFHSSYKVEIAGDGVDSLSVFGNYYLT